MVVGLGVAEVLTYSDASGDLQIWGSGSGAATTSGSSARPPDSLLLMINTIGQSVLTVSETATALSGQLVSGSLSTSWAQTSIRAISAQSTVETQWT